MKLVYPEYYSQFQCIADKCRHSCCKGWEIDIDYETCSFYKTLGGEIGKKLRENIEYEGDLAHFRLSYGERCPFLNEKNLCEIILELGEDALCQICSDHPRFRNFYAEKTEIGVGLCCEEAARIILSNTQKVKLCGADDEKNGNSFFKLREKMFEILQNREKPVKERIHELLEYFGLKMPDKSLSQWADIFLQLEHMDSNWTTLLHGLKTAEFSDMTEFETAFEQLAIYFIYRHLSDARFDGKYDARLKFAVLGCVIIGAMCNAHISKHGMLTLADLIEIARLYSSEIEYSQENIDYLLNVLDMTD